MDRENEREMTLEEEAKVFEEAALAEMLKVKGYGEWPVVNCVLQSGRRVVYRAMQELARRVEVVRCEKCLYRSQYCNENGLYKCGGIQNEQGDCFLMVEPTHFCAFGKWRGKLGAKMDGDGDG